MRTLLSEVTEVGLEPKYLISRKRPSQPIVIFVSFTTLYARLFGPLVGRHHDGVAVSHPNVTMSIGRSGSWAREEGGIYQPAPRKAPDMMPSRTYSNGN